MDCLWSTVSNLFVTPNENSNSQNRIRMAMEWRGLGVRSDLGKAHEMRVEKRDSTGDVAEDCCPLFYSILLYYSKRIYMELWDHQNPVVGIDQYHHVTCRKWAARWSRCFTPRKLGLNMILIDPTIRHIFGLHFWAGVLDTSLFSSPFFFFLPTSFLINFFSLFMYILFS